MIQSWLRFHSPSGNLPQLELRRSPCCISDISSPVLTRILIPRTKVGRAAADQTAARAVSPMTFSLQNASWDRIKTEYAASGAFANVHRDLQAWEDCARTLVLSTPANFELVAADWRNTPAPVLPRGAGAATAAARAAQLAIHFLRLASPTFFEDGSTQPLLCFSILAGACGPCLNLGGRHDPMGSTQLLAAQLRSQLGVDPTSADAVLVDRLRLTLRSTRLPAAWRSLAVSEEAMRQEVLDGIEYARSSEGRTAVELRRIKLLDNGCVAALPPLILPLPFAFSPPLPLCAHTTPLRRTHDRKATQGGVRSDPGLGIFPVTGPGA